MQRSGHMCQIYSKSLVRAIGKILIRTPIKTHKGDEKWLLFVNKQLFWWSASITMDNNKDVLADFYPFSHFRLNHIPQLAYLTIILPFGSLLC